jgi:hypothetical protein
MGKGYVIDTALVNGPNVYANCAAQIKKKAGLGKTGRP